MTAPAKQASRWGTFLQQAVAGVESRLDTILAEGQEENASIAAKPAPAPTPAAAAPKPDSLRNAPSSGTNTRLQERLARAVAAKNAGKTESLAPSSANASRTGSPAQKIESPRRSVEYMSLDDASASKEEHESSSVKEERQTPSIEVEKMGEAEVNGLVVTAEPLPRISVESTRSSLPRESIDSNRPRASFDTPSAQVPEPVAPQKSSNDYETIIQQLKSDYETSELQKQEEIHDYIERIDALQAKLQYLAKESAESAKKASTEASGGSLEKKLADKDEQVALLMEEGQKLSKKELTHLATIKKLRSKIQEDSKQLSESKAKHEKAEQDAEFANERLRRAEGLEKRVNEKQRLINQMQRDIESLKAERDARDSTIASLKTQLDEAAAQDKKAEMKVANDSLLAERKKVKDLEDDVANLKIEKNLISERAKTQVKELREKMDKDAEHSRMLELEMKSEQQMLESKLEVMRAKAEEASTGATGDAQAKLLRQIETLQTQYAVASENWQGIEASLVARVANVEKERDEATKREADIRKKAREVALKAKRNEDELEESRSKLPSFQQELASHKSQLDALQLRATNAESALAEARAKFEQEKQSWASELLQRIDEERQKWQEESSVNGLDMARAQSPVTSTRRGLTSEYLGLQNLQLRRASARSVNSDNPQLDRIAARRPSTQPLRSSGHGTPTRQDSMQSLVTNGESSTLPGTPSLHADHDDFFERNHSPTSAHQTINDMVSASTVAAGPSVQFVERMSHTVRRLESEKVATKEDIARLSAQRDEARAEIVMLMREIKEKRNSDTKVKELEAEVADVKARYDVTLEMLGEKSEQLEEAQSDILDLKAMYRELVERTVK